jgi:pyruvate/2-oxoglutarate dehydrogenase complex dihydrolipoamide dehydrogenase (E3) component
MFSARREPADYRALPAAVFTDPEVTSAGPSEEEARALGLEIQTTTVPLRGASRAGFTGRPHGIAKLVYEQESRRVVGVHLVTPTASDSIQFLAVAIRLGVTIDDLANSIHVYPSFGEIIKGAAEQAQAHVQPTRR